MGVCLFDIIIISIAIGSLWLLLIHGQKGDATAGTGIVVEQPFLDAFVVEHVPTISIRMTTR